MNNYKFWGTINCCLIKKMYHVQGEIGILIEDANKENFKIFFSSCGGGNVRCNKGCKKKMKMICVMVLFFHAYQKREKD